MDITAVCMSIVFMLYIVKQTAASALYAKKMVDNPRLRCTIQFRKEMVEGFLGNHLEL